MNGSAALDHKDFRLSALANMAMRGASLGGRLLLSVYMARDLGMYAVGIFGVITGVAGLAPSICGFGISYFVNRDILGLSRQDGYRLLRDRMAVNLCCVAFLWIVGILSIVAGLASPAPDLLQMAVIVTLEYLAFDLHIALINLRRPVVANFLLFIRSASWIPCVIWLGMWRSEFRTFDVLLDCWLMALIINFAATAYVFRDADLQALARRPVQLAPLFDKTRRNPLIYLNDMAANGQVFLDRFIVLKLLGVAATGTYTLFFSVTHGLYVLVAAAITQLSMPKLVAALGAHGIPGWRMQLISECRRAFAGTILVVAGALAGMLVILPAWHIDVFTTSIPLLLLMSAASLLKPIADLLNTGIYSLGLDRKLALVNLGGVLCSAICAALCIAWLGLVGVGVSGVISQLMLIAARLAVLHRRTGLLGRMP